MREKRIIFFPADLGIAHITRSLCIAKSLQKRGHQVCFAIHPQRASFVKAEKIDCLPVHVFLTENFRQCEQQLKSLSFVQKLVKQEIAVIDQFKAYGAVVDFRLTATAACAFKKIPTAFVIGSGGLPFGCHLPNPNLPSLVWAVIQPVINQFIWRYKNIFFDVFLKACQELGQPITLTEFLNRLIYIVPEVNGYLPAAKHGLDINYCGSLFWDGFAKYRPNWLKQIKRDGKTIYLTFGGTGFAADNLVGLTKLLLKRKYRVVVTSSNIAKEADFPQHPNLFVTKYISGWEISRRVDLVICHGGYGTLTQAVLSGTPVISVPFNPDQFLHGLRFQELGLGICILQLNLGKLSKLDWQMFLDLGCGVGPEKICNTVDRLIGKLPTYHQAIKEFRHLYGNQADAAEKATDIIEQKLF